MRRSIPSPVTLAWCRGACPGTSGALPTIGAIRAHRE